jgi:hypothetical protein
VRWCWLSIYRCCSQHHLQNTFFMSFALPEVQCMVGTLTFVLTWISPFQQISMTIKRRRLR